VIGVKRVIKAVLTLARRAKLRSRGETSVLSVILGTILIGGDKRES